MIGCIASFLITEKPEEREKKKVQISNLIKVKHRKVVRGNKGPQVGGQSQDHQQVIDTKKNTKTERVLIVEVHHPVLRTREIDIMTISIIAEEGTVDPEVQPVVIDNTKGAKKSQIDLEKIQVDSIILGVTTTDPVTEIITESIIPELMPKTELLTNTTKSIARAQVETEITTMGLLKTMVREWLA